MPAEGRGDGDGLGTQKLSLAPLPAGHDAGSDSPTLPYLPYPVYNPEEVLGANLCLVGSSREFQLR